jgi:hypothetical protein
VQDCQEKSSQCRDQEIVERFWTLEVNVCHTAEVFQHVDCAFRRLDSYSRARNVPSDVLTTLQVLSIYKDPKLVSLQREQDLQHHRTVILR